MPEWNNFDEKTLDAIWAVDSETGQEVLIDRRTNKIIATKEQVEGK